MLIVISKPLHLHFANMFPAMNLVGSKHVRFCVNNLVTSQCLSFDGCIQVVVNIKIWLC